MKAHTWPLRPEGLGTTFAGGLIMLILFAISQPAVAGTYTISAGGGILTYSATVKPLTCQYVVGAHVYSLTYYATSYSAFSFTIDGGTVDLLGAVNSVDDPTIPPYKNDCPQSTFPQTMLAGPQTGILFTPSGQTGGSALVGTAGWANPKYLILGVQYDPPGSSSTVTYGLNSVVGTSASVQKSFSTADQQSIMLSASIDIFGFTVNKETSTYSNTWTEEQDTSSSVAISQTTTSSATLKGYSDPKNGVNHDYDYINVWVNPLATFVIYPLQQGNLVQWTGYGYDLNDTKAAPDMDVIGVQLGCLNGDFYKKYSSGANKNWLTCVDLFNNNFNRSWAQKNTDGSSPALTPTLAKSVAPYDFCTQKGTDLYNICQADPFSNPTYAKGEIPPAAGLFTTKDGRFTACQNQGCSTTIDYQPGKCPLSYSQAYSTTLMQGQGYKNTYSESFSLASQFSEKGGSGKIFALTLSATLSTKNTLTWVEQFNQTTNNSQGQMASFSICGPAEGYQGPQQFVVYQDNLYGTFMFYPGN